MVCTVTIVVQLHGKYASTAMGLCFLCGLCRGVILKTIAATVWLSEVM
jgi:hypothetical protein